LAKTFNPGVGLPGRDPFVRTDRDRLNDILEAIAKIKARNTERLETFQSDEMLQVWVIHHLQVIGEAARGVSQSLKDRHPDVPWPEIVALRNILVHEYFGLNMHQVWTMTQRDLPVLEQHVENARAEIAIDPPPGP
jgi:uncharacterized protein with HEPN domain